MTELKKRITDDVLPNDYYKDGDILYGDDLNRSNVINKQGINANFDDIQRIITGETTTIISPDGSMKQVRLNSDDVIEVSTDGINWKTTASSGHIIMDNYGNEVAQRTRLQFLNTIVSDDGYKTIVSGIQGVQGVQGEKGEQGIQGEQGLIGATGPQGIQGVPGIRGEQGVPGINGRDGNSFVVRGRFNTYEELVTVYPTGDLGWAYAVGSASNNVVYNWDIEVRQWVNLGKLQGPAGADGQQGIQGEIGPIGPQGVQGVQGEKGAQGVQGEQGLTGPMGPQGQGIVTGGAPGQHLVKKSIADFDTGWENLPAPTVVRDILTSTSTTDALSANQGSVLKTLVDGKTSKLMFSVSFTVAGWTQNGPFFEQRIDVARMLSTYNPATILITSDTLTIKEQEQKNMFIREIQTFNGYIIGRCFEKPAVELNINLEVIDSNYIPYMFSIKVNAGRFNFSWNNPSGRKWIFPAGTVLYSDGTTAISESTAEKPDVIIANNNSYVQLVCNNWQGAYSLNDNDTNARFIGSLADLPPITYSLNLQNCSSITGSLADLPPITFYLNLQNCSLITGSLSDLPPLTNTLNLYNCSLITGSLADLPPLTYYLNLTNCSLITGAYTSVNENNVPNNTYLDNTGLSSTDMDNTLIAYANCTKDNGTFRANGMTRTSASDSAVSILTGRGWSITGITKV